MADNDKKPVSINIDPAVSGGIYSNLAIISHTHSEFILDFAAGLPGLPGPKVGSRVIMSPEHAKRLLNALADNVGKYESQFGKIEIVNPAPRTLNLADFNPSDAKS